MTNWRSGGHRPSRATFVRVRWVSGRLDKMAVRSFRHRIRIGGAVLVVVAVGGCAAATPGFQPASTKRSSLLERSKSFEAGDVVDNGAYKPSDNERALDCKRLLGSMKIIISRLKDSQNRPAPSAVAAVAQQTSASMGAKSIDMTSEEKREKARLVAYNQLLKDKQCAPLDIEQEMRGGGANAVPAAAAGAKKK